MHPLGLVLDDLEVLWNTAFPNSRNHPPVNRNPHSEPRQGRRSQGFPWFNQLPIDLQIPTWRFAAMAYEEREIKLFRRRMAHETPKVKVPFAFLAIMSVCQES